MTSTKIQINLRIPFMYLAIGLTVLIVFFQVGNHDFINLDDNGYVFENPNVLKGLSWHSVLWAFQTTYYDYWHPLPWLSHMLDVELFGKNPAGHHMTSVLVHLVNCLLLFHLLRKTTRAFWKSAIVSMLFAIHPLRIESVAWVAERKDLLSAFFFLLTIWAYIRYVVRPLWTRYAAIMLGLVLGMMSKPMVVTLPFLLVLLDYWPLGRFQVSSVRSLALEKLPLFILSVIGMLGISLVRDGESPFISFGLRSLSLRIENALVSYVSYIGKLLWPSELAIFYPYPAEIPGWQVLGAFLFLLIISLFVAVRSLRYPYLVTGWCWYLGTLFPVVGLTQWGLWPAMADRFTYIPCIGILIMIAWGFEDLCRRWRPSAVILGLAGCAAMAALIVANASYLSKWKDSATLFEYTTRVTEGNYMAYNNLGVALKENGNIERAIAMYQKSLDIYPAYTHARVNLAIVLDMVGRTDEAIEHLIVSLRTWPEDPMAHYNLGLSLLKKGRDLDGAIFHLKESLRLHPGFDLAQFNLGRALAAKGLINDAIQLWNSLIQRYPYHAEAHFALGTVLAEQGKLEEGIRHLSEAVRIHPLHGKAHYNLAVALEGMGRKEQAMAHYAEVLRIMPVHINAHYNLGLLYAEQSRYDEAVGHFRAALRINPAYAEAHNSLAVALLIKGRKQEAITHFAEALRINPAFEEARFNLYSLNMRPGTADSIEAKP